MERENAMSKQLTMKESEQMILEEKEAISRKQVDDCCAEMATLRDRDK